MGCFNRSTMKNKFICFLSLLFLCSCHGDGWKQLNFRVFAISVPDDWHYEKTLSFDSFAGQIKDKNLSLWFDYSEQGFANSLVPTKQDFLNVLWLHLHSSPFNANEPFDIPEGIQIVKFASFTRKSVLFRQQSLARSGNRQNDTTITFSDAVNNKRFKDSIPDYNAIIKCNNKTDTVPVYIPRQIKQQNITVDTAGKYITKTIWPKIAGRGMTGIFVYRTDSDFTFMLCGKNLAVQNQTLALRAFKTIKFKR